MAGLVTSAYAWDYTNSPEFCGTVCHTMPPEFTTYLMSPYDAPGCFRCHDGKHLNQDGQAVHLECNLCHSIPVVAGPDDFVADIEISRGPGPSSHPNQNWTVLHRQVFDSGRSNCHTTGGPGGGSNATFCSSNARRGRAWEYAGSHAPQLRQALAGQPSAPEQGQEPIEAGPPIHTDTIGPMPQSRCDACHAEGGMRGVNMSEYSALLAGGETGPVVTPGDPEDSLIVTNITGEEPHSAQLTLEELKLSRDWIAAGAPEQWGVPAPGRLMTLDNRATPIRDPAPVASSSAPPAGNVASLVSEEKSNV